MVALREICEKVDEIGADVVGLDATFGVTGYDFALFALRRSNDACIPLCYFISSSKLQLAVSLGLAYSRRELISRYYM
tara:strand:+ start:1181 stop:1414 length:234 start_codon:yes stop_codon:yes gene_type:complete